MGDIDIDIEREIGVRRYLIPSLLLRFPFIICLFVVCSSIFCHFDERYDMIIEKKEERKKKDRRPPFYLFSRLHSQLCNP
jgi:hypothetical protein